MMEITELIAPLRKWWWFILIATVLAGGSSYWFASQQPPVYQARATLMIGRALESLNPATNEFTLSQQLASAYADMAKREGVRDDTATALGLSALPEYTVSAPPNSLLIEIAVVDTEPARAQAVANELANQLVLRTPSAPQEGDQEQIEFVNEELAHLQASITETREEISAKQEELRTLVSAQEISDMQTQINGLQTKLNLLQSTYASLMANTQSGATNTLTIIERASLPRRPVGPNILYTVLTSAGLGLVMATTAAYVLSYLDDTVKEPEVVRRLTNLPVLASIGRFKHQGDESSLIVHHQPRSAVAEGFRELRTAIRFHNIDNPPRKLLITSPARNDGKSITAANLAVALAQAGQDVLLVDCDLRQPQQHLRFNLGNEQGLTDLLFLMELRPKSTLPENASLSQGFIQRTQVVGLSVLTSGSIPPNPSEILGSEKMKVALEKLTGIFDMVILDSPPSLAVTDAAVLSTQVDGVIMVARAGKTRQNQLQKAVQRLQDVNAKLLGVSLNSVRRLEPGYYYTEDAKRQGPDGEEEIHQNGARTKRNWRNLRSQRADQPAPPNEKH
jgi:polysaccharide biosynthesis transport protein